jgi:hypothetical protein
VLSLINRSAFVLLVLALASSGWAQCAGWQSTAEARWSCCASDDCPMHRSDGDDSTGATMVSQAQADSCCASAERGNATPSASPHVSSFPVAVLTSPIPALGSDVAAFRTRNSRTPTDVSPVPKHLLLSVFLI